MTDTWDQFSRRLALVYALVALVVLVLYLAFDFQRSWSRSVSTLREQAVAALSWAERGMDAASEAMSSAATAGSRACVAGAVEPRVLSHMLNVPLDRVTIATGGRVLCEWTAPQSTLTACSTGQPAAMAISRTQDDVTATARIYPACMLAPFALSVDGVGLGLREKRERRAAGEPDALLTLASARWPVQLDVSAPPYWLLRRWMADLPLQIGFFALVGLAIYFGPLAALRRRLSIEGQVRTALKRGEFFLTYLPTIEVNTGHWLGVEALMRWRHSRHGLLQPAAFIPWIERSPLIHDTTSWVLRQAASDLARMNELHHELYVGINLPPNQLSDERVVDAALDAFGNDQLCLCRVMFELTERETTDYASPEVQRVVARLRERGAQFALDDFGIGFSNLASLALLEIDFIKVDKSFIQELERRGTDPNIVDSIVHVAREFGVGIIAEGIETERQLDRIRRIGIRMAQGFLFFRPMEVEATLDQLRLQTQ
ncbi:EAL domain-containing protein [Azorhizobium caulinodans]|uniref:EAL domain-containing protein n=1 Tax=Azorhizobium caulinodans TaxID=7 RepID=UPI002FBDC20A